jgi:hypothetical protein
MERMEKQTAVEWLVNELGEYFPHEIGGIHLMIKQAKEMEKEQIIDFADSYGTYLLVGGTMSAGTYNETFKSE